MRLICVDKGRIEQAAFEYQPGLVNLYAELLEQLNGFRMMGKGLARTEN